MIQNNFKMIKTNSLSGNQTGQWNFNPDKCKVLRIINERMLITRNYIMHSQVLEVVDSSKYLGIHIHKQLSWNTHVGHVVKKANQVRYFLQKNLRNCHPEVKFQCYKTYIRPISEYGSIVWDPHNNGNIEKVEMVQ